MNEIIYKGTKGLSQILIGESFLEFNKYTQNYRVVFVTDNILYDLYSDFFNSYQTVVIPAGEENKNVGTIEMIYYEFVKINVDRSTFVIGFGGGVLSDLVGFAASTFMRGLNFGFISSTLLSQVDASIGGKNGFNFGGLKNMIGTFNQPRFVICDHNLLKTLSHTEFINGVPEIIKTALIYDLDFFEFIENHKTQISERNSNIVNRLILKSVEIKKKFVELDETEKGIRKVLNFGHTLAHAIEKSSTISHGQAVSIGIIFAAHWSLEKCNFSIQDFLRIKNLLSSFGLPTNLSADKNEIFSAILSDKKRTENKLEFVFIDKIGKSNTIFVEFDEIKKKILCFV